MVYRYCYRLTKFYLINMLWLNWSNIYILCFNYSLNVLLRNSCRTQHRLYTICRTVYSVRRVHTIAKNRGRGVVPPLPSDKSPIFENLGMLKFQRLERLYSSILISDPFKGMFSEFVAVEVRVESNDLVNGTVERRT